ncbi:MAG: hypothetical protein KDK53_01255 [Maritimibacter sp.]|nr:hypothetical protein [Maritimibacter sp.]
MPNRKEALDNIRAACKALEQARKSLSAALLDHADEEGRRGGEYAALQDLHRRVSQAAALLPHGGGRT